MSVRCSLEFLARIPITAFCDFILFTHLATVHVCSLKSGISYGTERGFSLLRWETSLCWGQLLEQVPSQREAPHSSVQWTWWQDRTSGFLLKACARLCYSLRNSLAFIILWNSQGGHSAHNAPRALLAYMCKLNFAVKLIRCHEE